MSISKFYIPFVFLAFLSCGEFEEKSSSMNDTVDVSVHQNINIELENTIFSIPSPVQIAMELSDSNSSFSQYCYTKPKNLKTTVQVLINL